MLNSSLLYDFKYNYNFNLLNVLYFYIFNFQLNYLGIFLHSYSIVKFG